MNRSGLAALGANSAGYGSRLPSTVNNAHLENPTCSRSLQISPLKLKTKITAAELRKALRSCRLLCGRNSSSDYIVFLIFLITNAEQRGKNGLLLPRAIDASNASASN
eukprot:1153728-Pelagomonas_calceolata.AAC.4